MVRIEGQIVIGCPVEDVFDVVSDERNEPRFNPKMVEVEQLTSGPIGVGTQFRAESRVGRGTDEMTIEITGFERPRRLASRTRMSSMDIDGELTFVPIVQGTLMHWSWAITPHGFYRVLGAMIARVGDRQEKEIWSGFKRFMEDQGKADPIK